MVHYDIHQISESEDADTESCCLQTTVATEDDVTARTCVNDVLAVVHAERNARTTPQSETQRTRYSLL